MPGPDRTRGSKVAKIATQYDLYFGHLAAIDALPLNKRSNLMVYLELGSDEGWRQSGKVFKAGLMKRGITILPTLRPPTPTDEGKHFLHAFRTFDNSLCSVYGGYTGCSWDNVAARSFDGEREAWAVREQGGHFADPVQGYPLDVETLRLILGLNPGLRESYVEFSRYHIRPTTGHISYPIDYKPPKSRLPVRKVIVKGAGRLLGRMSTKTDLLVIGTLDRLPSDCPSITMGSVSDWTPSQLDAFHGGPGIRSGFATLVSDNTGPPQLPPIIPANVSVIVPPPATQAPAPAPVVTPAPINATASGSSAPAAPKALVHTKASNCTTSTAPKGSKMGDMRMKRPTWYVQKGRGGKKIAVKDDAAWEDVDDSKGKGNAVEIAKVNRIGGGQKVGKGVPARKSK